MLVPSITIKKHFYKLVHANIQDNTKTALGGLDYAELEITYFSAKIPS